MGFPEYSAGPPRLGWLLNLNTVSPLEIHAGAMVEWTSGGLAHCLGESPRPIPVTTLPMICLQVQTVDKNSNAAISAIMGYFLSQAGSKLWS